MNLPFFLKRVAKVRLFSLPPNFSALFFEKISLFYAITFQYTEYQHINKIVRRILLYINNLTTSLAQPGRRGKQLNNWHSTHYASRRYFLAKFDFLSLIL